MPPSYAAEPLSGLINPGKEPVSVWADLTGDIRGIEIVPLYKTVVSTGNRYGGKSRNLSKIDNKGCFAGIFLCDKDGSF